MGLFTNIRALANNFRTWAGNTVSGIASVFGARYPRAARDTFAAPYYKSVTELSPSFTTPNARLYEEALTRAVVEKFANLTSKLKPEVTEGTTKPVIRRLIKTAPNDFQSWPEFIARVATLYLADTNAAIVPALDDAGNITGLFPFKFETCEIVEYADEAWARFTTGAGDVYAIEYRNVCLLTRFQYQSDFFGSGNRPLEPVLNLLDYQEQANSQAIKNGAKVQFIGQITSMVHPEDLDKKRKKFSQENLSAQNTSGLILYDQTFNSLQQVDPKSYTVDTDEMERIENNVFNYFGINKSILQSDYSEEQFGAYYESEIEPFATKLGEGLTNLCFTKREQAHGNRISFSANRLSYASNASKRNMIRDMLDRRILTINESREILQLPPVPGGDVFIERGEYVQFDPEGNVLTATGGKMVQQVGGVNLHGNEVKEKDFDLGGDDDEYNSTEMSGLKEEDN